MKKLFQIISLTGLSLLAGCKNQDNISSPYQEENEARAKIIQQDYLSESRQFFGKNDPTPNYPIDRLFDKKNSEPIYGL